LLQYLFRFKASFILSLIAVGLLIIAENYQSYWSIWLETSNKLIYVLGGITIVFAAQFSRSRYSFVILLWLLFYFLFSANFNLHNAVASLFPDYTQSSFLRHIGSSQWLMLSGLIACAVFVVIKDRGLLTVYSVYRIVLFLFSLTFALLWLSGVKEILPQYIPPQYNYVTNLLVIEFPLLITGVLLSWKIIKKQDLFLASLFFSVIVMCLYYYKVISVPLSISLSIVFCLYWLAVIIDAYFLAYRDELTGLPSRRALYQLVLSLGRKYTVAMIDIDHFKKFNDTYGHDIGDQVLKLVAVKLQKVKGGGRVFRYGGEEFTIVFPRKEATQSATELEQLRQSIADYKIVIRHPQRKGKDERKKRQSSNEKTVSVTISIGVAMRERKQSFDEALKCADEALYRAKKGGRNKVSY